MGTRWRGLLAPINKPTGDGRRFKEGSVTHRELPLPLKWQRVDAGGHDDSVIVGLMDKVTIDDKAGEVWGEGELFDDQPHLPRLTEDVNEAILLTQKKTIGPSVDAGAADAMIVEEGSDEPLTDERLDELWLAAVDGGEEPKLEMLFTHYEIAAATLVAIPAFGECRPFELVTSSSDAPVEEPTPAALVAAITAAAAEPTYNASWFENPGLTRVTPITVTSDGRVYGHAAQWGVCHVGIPEVCVKAPGSKTDYAMFHRMFVDTDAGLQSVGRLTTGHGRIGTGCNHLSCRGKDDHGCDKLSLAGAIEHYDRLKTLAWLRAGEDDHGIWIAGALAGPLGADDQRVLNRRKVSGDWRPVGTGHEMTEVLALAKEEPGFPLSVTLLNGRQGALLAAGGVRPDQETHKTPSALAQEVARLVADQIRPLLPTVPAAITAATEHTGAMVALVPSEEDAARLAVDGGEPAGELHMTMAYLGAAADIDEDTQQSIISAMTALAGDLGPVVGDAFAVNVFNPASDDRETAIVLGVSGDALEPAHSQVVEALSSTFESPEQHAPWVAHVTLTYSDDLSLVEQYADRTNQPITFDRIRVAFAGAATDIPLSGAAPEGDGPETAAALLAELDHSIATVDPDAIRRTEEAASLLGELGELEVASGV